MIANLVVASLMVAVTVVIHFFGLAGLIGLLTRRAPHLDGMGRVSRQGVLIVAVVLGLFAIHTVEIWSYAVLYRLLGEFATFEEALYFSTSTFTTVGFGDVVLGPEWRMLSAIESANGFLLIGWSTAFLINVTARLRALETEWVEHRTEERARDEAVEALKSGRDG